MINSREHQIIILVCKYGHTEIFEKINFLPSFQKMNVDWLTCRRPAEQRLPVAGAQATKSVVYIGSSVVSALYMVCTHSIVVVG